MGSSHIAYHLAVLALEEIGKSILIFQEFLDRNLSRTIRKASPAARWTGWRITSISCSGRYGFL